MTHRWRHALFALALLLTQQLAWVHSISHGQAHHAAAAFDWGHQSGDASCDLFDQLCQPAGPLFVAPMPAPFATPAVQAPDTPSAIHAARFWARGARGPPLLS